MGFCGTNLCITCHSPLTSLNRRYINWCRILCNCVCVYLGLLTPQTVLSSQMVSGLAPVDIFSFCNDSFLGAVYSS